jgi:hypothetical protein
MFERIRLGCEGAYNFFINNLGHPAGGAYSDMDDRLLDAVHSIENNLTRDIYRLKREK